MDENAHRHFSTPNRERNGAGAPPFLSAILWLTIVFLVGMILGNLLWLAVADIFAFGRENTFVEISIASADTLSDVAQTLKEHGLISYPRLFRLFARVTHAENISPGSYTLNKRLDYPALLNALGA